MAQIMAQKKATFGGIGNTNVPRAPLLKARNWCFTLNNYTLDDIGTILCENRHENLKVYCFQEEIGESGTPHLQGTIGYKNAIHFNSVRKLLPRAHWEKCKSLKSALAYCSKFESRKKDTIPYTFRYTVFNDGKPLTDWDICEELYRQHMEDPHRYDDPPNWDQHRNIMYGVDNM